MRKKVYIAALLAVLGSGVVTLSADERVHLRNGNYLDGVIVSDDSGSITLQTRYGTVILNKSDIVSTERPPQISQFKPSGHLDRIHLRNDNYIEGDIIKETADTITLRTKSGTFALKKADILSREGIEKEEPLQPVKKHTPFKPPVEDDEEEEDDDSGSKAPPKDEEKSEPNVRSDIKTRIDAMFKIIPKVSDNERYSIIKEIVELGSDVVPYLMYKMDDANPLELSCIATAIALMKDVDVLDQLVEKLSSDKQQVRSVAVSILANVGNDSILPVLRKRLRDSDATVRGITAAALTKLNDVDSISDVANLLSDPEQGVRRMAVMSVLEMASKNKEAVPDVVEALGELLDSASPQAQADIADILGKLGNKEAIPHLVKLIDSSSKEIKASAIISLGRLKAAEAVELLVERLGAEEDRWVRIQIATALQETRDKKAIPALIEMLSDEDLDMKLAASRALQGITNEHFGTDPSKWANWWKEKTGTK